MLCFKILSKLVGLYVVSCFMAAVDIFFVVVAYLHYKKCLVMLILTYFHRSLEFCN